MCVGQRLLRQQSGEKAQLVKHVSWAKVGFGAFLFLFIRAALPQEKPCCPITDIDTPTGLVSAKVNTTGQSFQFKPNTPGLLASMRVGEGVYANFKAGQVSVNGKDAVGTIVSLGPAKGPLTPAAPRAPQPGISSLAAPENAPQGGVAQTVGASAACCGITSIDAGARLVAAKENSTGAAFDFSLPGSVPIQNLHAGQSVWANFKARKASLDGQTACCDIVKISTPGSGGSTAVSGAAGSGTPGPVVFVPQPQVGPSITSLTAQPTLIFGPTTTRDTRYTLNSCSTVAVTLSSPAPGGGEDVPVSIDQPAIASLWSLLFGGRDGASLHVYAGQQTGYDSLCATTAVLAPTEVHITAQAPGPLGGNAKTGSLTVWPPVLEAFAVEGSPPMSTYRINYNAWLLGGAPPGGFLVEMTSSNPSVIPSRKFVIPEKSPYIREYDYAPLVTAPTQVTLTAKGYIPQAPKGPRPVQMTQVQWVPEILPPPPFSGTGFQHPGPTGDPTTFTQTITVVPLDLALTDAKLVGVVLADGSVADPPPHICPGLTLKGRVVLNHSAGHLGVQVQLQDMYGNIYLPLLPYATVPEGYDTGDFTFKVGPNFDNTYPVLYRVTAIYKGVSKNIDFSVYDCAVPVSQSTTEGILCRPTLASLTEW